MKHRTHEILRTDLNEPGVSAPAVDHAPLDPFHLACLAPSVQLIQTAPCRTAAVLWVLRERDRALHAVCLHLPRRLICKRARIPESDVVLVRCSRGVQLVQQRGHALALQVRVTQDRRAATDVGVLLLDFRSAPACNQGCDDGLEGQRDEVAVREEVFEEVVCLWYLLRRRQRPV